MTPAPDEDPSVPDLEPQSSLVGAILEASPDGVLVVDARGLIVAHNRRLLDLFGISQGPTPGCAMGSLASQPDRPLLAHVLGLVSDPEGFLARVTLLYADPLLVDACEVPLKDGRTLERHSCALRGVDRVDLGRVWFFRDISVRKRIEAELRELSVSDPLTGLANRRQFFDVAARELERARRSGQPLTLIMFDIDRFKRINDRWGHVTGDLVLRALSACARREVRSMDLLARIGGEEFAILAPETDAEGAQLLAERVRDRVSALEVRAGNDLIRVTISLGVAEVRPGDASPDDVLGRADSAMYLAKRAGRDRVVLAPPHAASWAHASEDASDGRARSDPPVGATPLPESKFPRPRPSMEAMGNQEARARLLAEVDEVLRETPIAVVLDAIRRAARPSAAPDPVPEPVASGTLSEDAYFRLIFDGSGLGIALVDTDGRPIRCNPALERILGYGSDELGRMSLPQFTHPDDVAADAELFRELLAGRRQQYQIEKRYVRKDGRSVVARLTVSLSPRGGRHTIAMLEDITTECEERDRHAATLRALEARVAELTALHELSALLRDSGLPLGQVLETVARTLHGASRVPSASAVRVTLDDLVAEVGPALESTRTSSVTFGAPGGRQGRIELFHATEPRATVAPPGRTNQVQLLQTVSELLGAMLARRRAEERLTLAVTSGKVAVWELDLHTGVIAWPGQDPARMRAWPWDSADTLAGFMSLVHPDDRAYVERELRATSDDPSRRGRYQAEYRIVPPDGPTQLILASGQTLYDDASRPERIFGVAIDVTERRGLESQLLQAQKMEAIGQLAGGVAHDFNNLLCAILGYGQLVADELGPTHALTPQVQQIVKAGHAAGALTRQLLAFSRRQALEPRVLDLNKVIQGVVEMIRHLVGEDVSVAVDLEAEPAVVRADSGQIEQILINLAVNAGDAMSGGGRIAIRTRFEPGGEPWGAQGASLPVGPWVVLSVADVGAGMDPATQARIFEPFFTTKPEGLGTGLGLATVRGIVEQCGGHVRFTSVPGEGTEFRVYLPRLALVAEEEDLAPVDLHAFVGDETILVAEDQEPVRQIVRIWLERRGYRVLEAPDGRAGVAVAAAHGGSIDLLVTDVVMPKKNGGELAKALRLRDPDLPVIYMSGYTSTAIERRGALEGGCLVLDKPLSEATLLRAVRETLDARGRAVGARGGGDSHD